MDTPTLSPCPVCGEIPELVFVTFVLTRLRCYGPNADAHGGRGVIAGEPGRYHSEVITSWNEAVARYTPPTPEGII